MELTKEFIDTHKLSEDQVKAVTEFGKSVIADEKGKLAKELEGDAHKNAQGILSGAAEAIEKRTGIKRKEGEKIADFIDRSSNEYMSSKNAELDKLKSDYEEKIKGVKDAGTLKDEYEKMKKERAEILDKYKDYDELKEKATKAEEYGAQLSGLKLEMAFTNAKPSFPESVNPFEAAARWDEFQKEIKAKYNIEMVEGVAMAVDKSNQYSVFKLTDLVAKNEVIQTLLKGRQQGGTGAKTGDTRKIEGVPFDVPKNGTKSEIATAIRNYLTTQNIGLTDQRYSSEFSKYHTLITKQTA